MTKRKFGTILVLACWSFAFHGAVADGDEMPVKHFFKRHGDVSQVNGACTGGTGFCRLEFRVRRGTDPHPTPDPNTVLSVYLSQTNIGSWTVTWLEEWGTGDFSIDYHCSATDGWEQISTYTIADSYVLSVPKYVFAQATYATPIQFTIHHGNWQTVWIETMQVRIYLNSFLKKTVDVAGRFVATGGSHNGMTQKNGQSATYTCFVLPEAYGDISLPARRTGNVEFALEVKYKENQQGVTSYTKILRTGTYEGNDNGDIKAFGDNTLTAVEPGRNGASKEHHISLGDVSQVQAVQYAGVMSYEHYKSDDGNPPPCGTLPHNPTGNQACLTVLADAFETKTQIIGTVIDLNNSQEIGAALHVKLEDDWDWIYPGNVGEGYKNRVYSYRRGGYFYCSYGASNTLGQGEDGVGPRVLPANVFAMDINWTTGAYDQIVFPNGEVGLEANLNSESGFNLSSLTIAPFKYAWKLIPKPGDPFTDMIFKKIEDWFSVLLDVETDEVDNAGECSVCAVWTRSGPGAGDQEADFIGQKKTLSKTDKVRESFPVKVENKSATIGNQYACFIEMNVIVSAVSRGLLASIESDATAIFDAGSHEEWTHMLVKVR